MLKEGDKAPKFKATAHDGSTVSLSDFKGKNLILYFYPKANTPGCTHEANAFRNDMDKFKAANTEIVGCSGDTVEARRLLREARAEATPFPRAALLRAQIAERDAQPELAVRLRRLALTEALIGLDQCFVPSEVSSLGDGEIRSHVANDESAERRRLHHVPQMVQHHLIVFPRLKLRRGSCRHQKDRTEAGRGGDRFHPREIRRIQGSCHALFSRSQSEALGRTHWREALLRGKGRAVSAE